MATEELKRQGEVIDNPNKPVEARAVSRRVLEEMISGTHTLTSPTQYDSFRERSRSMAPQIQGEFESWDPKYDRGLLSGNDQYPHRAENQSNWDRTRAGLAKALSEVTLGTLGATALMLDADMHLNAFRGTEEDFSNSISRYLDEQKEALNARYGTIYRKRGTEGFSPGSWGFWMDNADSVMTALTLMIPSMGAVQAASALGKLSRAHKFARMSTAKQQMVKGASAAVLSRLTENAMEASESVLELREELKDMVDPKTGQKFTEAEINKMAGEAGVMSWKRNWYMLVPDMIQYGRAFKGIDFARRSAKEAVKKSLTSKVGKFVMRDMGWEAFEEGFQYVSGEEAQRSVLVDRGLIEDDSGFLERLSQYIIDDEFKTGVLMGAVGGGIFAGAGRITSRMEQNRQAKERMRMQDIQKTYDSAIFGSSEKFEQAQNQEIITNAIQKAAQGDLHTLEADLVALYNEPSDVLEAQGINVDEYRSKVAEAQQLVKNVAKEYNNVMNSAIPDQLKNAALFSRLDRQLSEKQKTQLSEVREALYDNDLINFTSKEKSTAMSMVELKRLEHNDNKKKADELAKTIVENSNKYKNVGEVYDALNTSNDVQFDRLSKIEEGIDKRIKESEQFEKDIKTERGIEKRIKEAEKLQAEIEAKRTELEAKRAKESEETTDTSELETSEDRAIDPSRLTEGQRKYTETREKKAKEIGEHDPKTVDGKKVFTTSNREHIRTWVKGETVKDGKGNEWIVSNPVKGNTGVFLRRKKKTKDSKEINEGTSFEIAKRYGELSHETQKPGRKDWSVNKFLYDPVKQRQKQLERDYARESKIHEDAKEGIIQTSGQEFENFKPVVNEDGSPVLSNRGRQVWKFDEHPIKGEQEWFPIDYDLASRPMKEGEIQEATIILDTSMEKDAIRVQQEIDGRTVDVAMIMPKGMEQQFDNLLEYLSDNGGTITAKIIGKYVTPEGNLGTIVDTKTNLNRLKGSPFLPNGKVYIGSRKNIAKESKELEFYAEDGSTIKLDVSMAQNERGSFIGNTYMLLTSPNGDMVPVQLNESTLNEIQVKDENGNDITLAEQVMNNLETDIIDLESRYNKMIQEEVDKGSSIKIARKRAKKYFGFIETEGKTDTPVQRILNKHIWSNVNRVRQMPVKDDDGKIVRWETGRNFFNARLEVIEGEGALENSIQLGVTNAVPETDVGKIANYKTDTSYTREGALEKLGGRFITMSLDQMRSPEGANYIKQAIEGGWVTTDLNIERPWVNTRLRLQLDSGAKKALGKDIKKPTKITKPSKTKGKKSVADLAKDDTSINTRDQLIKEASSDVNNITEIMAESTRDKKTPFSITDFVNKHLEGIVTVEEFNNLVVEEVRKLHSAKPDQRELPRNRKAIKNVTQNLIENATDTQLNIDAKYAEDTKTSEKIESDTKTDKQKDSGDPITDLFGPSKITSDFKGVLGTIKKSDAVKKNYNKEESIVNTPTNTLKSTQSAENILSSYIKGDISGDVSTLGGSMSVEGVNKAKTKAKNKELKVNCKPKK